MERAELPVQRNSTLYGRSAMTVQSVMILGSVEQFKIVIASEAKQSIFQLRARAALQPARAQLGLAGGKLREEKWIASSLRSSQ
jgi:hypothetical protein